MDHTLIENKFAEYILGQLGPNKELDNQREEKFNFLKQIITNAIEKEFFNIKPHIFIFGSFPLKTYLQDSDLDITILFEDKTKNCFLMNYSFDFLNKMLITIQASLETSNSESNSQMFTDINMIFADIKLIKCKYGNLSIDISINNFTGLSKLIFMNFVEKKFEEQYGKNQNPMVFKKALIMIKAWCYYEGGILGSNISLMANYALEVMVIYIFNNYPDLISNEVDAFFLFFKIIKDFNWDDSILHLFGSIEIDSFLEKAKLYEESNLPTLSQLGLPAEPLWYVNADDNCKIGNNFCKSSQSVIKFEDFVDFVKKFEKFKDIDKTQNFNTNRKSITVKYLNIIDPMFNNNNLGKSISFHNFSKIKKVVELVYSDIEKIISLRNTNNPLKYLNSLLKLFSKSQISNSPELFFNTLSQPKIVINPYLNMNDETLSKNVSVRKENSLYGENNHNFHVNKYFDSISQNFTNNSIFSVSSLNSTMVSNYNKIYSKSSGDNISMNSQSLIKIEENKISTADSLNGLSQTILQELYITKEILEYMTRGANNNTITENQHSNYTYPLYYESDIINDILFTEKLDDKDQNLKI